MIVLELLFGIVVALLAAICAHKVWINKYKEKVAFEKMLRSLEEQRYESDLELLERLNGKKFSEETRKTLLTPTGHELVTWVLEHQEKK